MWLPLAAAEAFQGLLLLWDLCIHLQAPRSLLESCREISALFNPRSSRLWDLVPVLGQSRRKASIQALQKENQLRFMRSKRFCMLLLVQQGFEGFLLSPAWLCSSHPQPRSPGVQHCAANAEQRASCLEKLGLSGVGWPFWVPVGALCDLCACIAAVLLCPCSVCCSVVLLLAAGGRTQVMFSVFSVKSAAFLAVPQSGCWCVSLCSRLEAAPA